MFHSIFGIIRVCIFNVSKPTAKLLMKTIKRKFDEFDSSCVWTGWIFKYFILYSIHFHQFSILRFQVLTIVTKDFMNVIFSNIACKPTQVDAWTYFNGLRCLWTLTFPTKRPGSGTATGMRWTSSWLIILLLWILICTFSSSFLRSWPVFWSFEIEKKKINASFSYHLKIVDYHHYVQSHFDCD